MSSNNFVDECIILYKKWSKTLKTYRKYTNRIQQISIIQYIRSDFSVTSYHHYLLHSNSRDLHKHNNIYTTAQRQDELSKTTLTSTTL